MTNLGLRCVTPGQSRNNAPYPAVDLAFATSGGFNATDLPAIQVKFDPADSDLAAIAALPEADRGTPLLVPALFLSRGATHAQGNRSVAEAENVYADEIFVFQHYGPDYDDILDYPNHIVLKAKWLYVGVLP
ncbi:MAG: hypothetical protein GY862_04915 [Gammaproteobacteria bacterium]|nr:hypothetical protein [Gammaproteobacteria bacterium]